MGVKDLKYAGASGAGRLRSPLGALIAILLVASFVVLFLRFW